MFMKVEEISDNATINLVLDTLKINKQALVFVNTKRSAEKTAEDISKKIKLKDLELEKLSNDILTALPKPTKQCIRLSNCVKSGIAFHHSGLVARQRELIEKNFREGKIKIISCTPTLAAGVDLPAYRVIIRDLKRFGHHGMDYILVLEYQQMAGRAGRPKFDTYGESICIASSEIEKDDIEERFINGDVEQIYSKLAVEPVFRTYLLSLIVSNVANSKKSLIEFFSKTFFAHQFKDMSKIEKLMDKNLYNLGEWGFIKKNDDFVSAIDFGDRIKPTELGKRVAELYLDPLTAHEIIERLGKAKGKIDVFALIQAAVNTLEMRHLLKVRAKEYDMIRQEMIKHELYEKEPNMYDEYYDDFLNSIKTTMCLVGWIEEKDEDYLMENFNTTPGELRSKLDISDWLFYAMEEFARMQGRQEILKDIAKVRVRLKYGAKEELLPLLKLEGIGRARARTLFKNNIKDLGDVKKVEVTTLSNILGKSIAASLKKQVGENEKKQNNLDDY